MYYSLLSIVLPSILVIAINAVTLPDDFRDTSLKLPLEEQPSGTGNIVPLTLPDGRYKIVVFENGEYEGYIIEGQNGACEVYDASGNELDIEAEPKDGDSDSNETENNIQRRWIPLIIRLARVLAPIIKRWGKRVWDFVNCVGVSGVWECNASFLRCAEMGLPPWKCPGGFACLASKGKAVKKNCL
jgi:hypothetical protein